MKALPKQQRALAKREALITAAESCFSELGYEGCTAKLIAERAAVATGTFYQYFANKDDMLHTLALRRLEVLTASLDKASPATTALSIEARLARSLDFIYDFHARQPALHQILEHRRHRDPRLAETLDRGEQQLQQHVTRFVRSLNLNQAEVVAFNLFAMAEGVVHRHVFGSPPRPDKNAVIQQAAAMLASYLNSASR